MTASFNATINWGGGGGGGGGGQVLDSLVAMSTDSFPNISMNSVYFPHLWGDLCYFLFFSRGGKICLTDHFKPLWARNVPKFGIAHAMALGVCREKGEGWGGGRGLLCTCVSSGVHSPHSLARGWQWKCLTL